MWWLKVTCDGFEVNDRFEMNCSVQGNISKIFTWCLFNLYVHIFVCLPGSGSWAVFHVVSCTRALQCGESYQHWWEDGYLGIRKQNLYEPFDKEKIWICYLLDGLTMWVERNSVFWLKLHIYIGWNEQTRVFQSGGKVWYICGNYASFIFICQHMAHAVVCILRSFAA